MEGKYGSRMHVETQQARHQVSDTGNVEDSEDDGDDVGFGIDIVPSHDDIDKVAYSYDTSRRGDLILCLSEGEKAGIAFQVGAVMALGYYGLLSRVRIVSATGSGIWTASALINAWAQPPKTSVADLHLERSVATLQQEEEQESKNKTKTKTQKETILIRPNLTALLEMAEAFCTRNTEYDMFTNRLPQPWRWLSQDIVEDYRASLSKSCRCKLWDHRISPILLFHGEQDNGASKGHRLLTLTNDTSMPHKVEWRLLQQRESLMQQTAALSCPYVFGFGSANCMTETVPRIRNAMQLDPLALHVPRIYFIKHKMSRDVERKDSTPVIAPARLDNHKLLLIDAFSSTQLAERQSALHRKLVKRELDDIQALPDEAGEHLLGFNKGFVQMANFRSQMPHAMEEVIKQALALDVRCTSLPLDMFRHLVNWGFMNTAFTFCNQRQVSSNPELARSVPFSALLPVHTRDTHSVTT